MTPQQADRVESLGQLAGVQWFDHQFQCFEHVWLMWDSMLPTTRLRLGLYYKTGAGKTITSLVCMNIWHRNKVLVIAPPSTHDKWIEDGLKLGMTVEVMSHAKFRMKDTKVSRDTAVIADEFHLFGGHDGKGWKKLDTMARHLDAPLILASATPNYNDADRVYCIHHVLAPHEVKGGFLEFLYKNCETEQNHFSVMPDVTGFRNYASAEEYLAALPNMMYLPDTAQYVIDDWPIAEKIPPEMEEFGFDPRKKRMIASIIEAKHARVFHSLIDDKGRAQKDVRDCVIDWVETAVSSVLIYANHSTVAEALSQSLWAAEINHRIVTGDTTQSKKQEILDAFRAGEIEVLIGTATLATGTDGLDKICDWLIIVDDTEDDSLRRQLIGRILPRGSATATAHKNIKRLVIQ